MYYLSSENKAADQIRRESFAVTTKLFCVFVFADAKSRFSHDAAQLSRLGGFNEHQPPTTGFMKIKKYLSIIIIHLLNHVRQGENGIYYTNVLHFLKTSN